MKDIKNIIAETPNAFLWGDGETVDITLDDEDDKTFIQILIDYKCLVCDNRIVMDNEANFKTDLYIDTNNNSMCVWTYFFKPSEARKLKLKTIIL